MTSILRAGVIGAGVFGGYHAAQYDRLPDVTLSAVLDADPARAAALAARHGAVAFTDLAPFLAASDVVSVATPAIHHGALALAVLKSGRPVYVEKPLATSPDDADSIVREASRRSACSISRARRCAWRRREWALPRRAISMSRW